MRDEAAGRGQQLGPHALEQTAEARAAAVLGHVAQDRVWRQNIDEWHELMDG